MEKEINSLILYYHYLHFIYSFIRVIRKALPAAVTQEGNNRPQNPILITSGTGY